MNGGLQDYEKILKTYKDTEDNQEVFVGFVVVGGGGFGVVNFVFICYVAVIFVVLVLGVFTFSLRCCR